MSGLIKVAVLAVVIALIALIATNLPDLKRYLRLRTM
jgi:hypothetical protein